MSVFIKNAKGMYLHVRSDGTVEAKTKLLPNNKGFQFDIEELSGPGNGLRHDWMKSTGAFLYPAGGTWPFFARAMGEDWAWVDGALRTMPAQRSTHIVITANVGTRPELRSRRFSCKEWPQKAKDTLDQIIQADKAPACFIADQEFYKQNFGTFSDFLDHVKYTVNLLESRVSWFCGMWEIGDLWGSNDLDKRHAINMAIRQNTDKPIGVHERSLEGIPVSDLSGIKNTMSLLQTGFDTDPDEAVLFLRSNVVRMKNRIAGGSLRAPHVVGVFEHSIPLVYPAQPWKPTRTYSEAVQRGKYLVQQSGVAFDMSGGQV